jgi:hypothetical protein
MYYSEFQEHISASFSNDGLYITAGYTLLEEPG